MKLHRIRLRNYRGVVDSEVEFAERGVTIVQGPNEVGKTSISEAFGLAIRFADNSTDRRVRSVRPVSRDDGTEVEFELSTGPYRLEFEKRWFRKPGTTLNVMAPRNENHSDRAAHDRLNEILAETLDDKLMKALQIEQGTELKLPGFKNVSSISKALEKAAGGDVTGAEEATPMDRIREEYDRYWTPTGRRKGERKSSNDRVTAAEEEVRDLKGLMEEIDRDAKEMERLSGEVERISATRDDSEKIEGGLLERWTAIEGMRRDVESKEALRRAAESRRDQVAGEWERRREMIESLSARAKKLTVLEAEAEEAAPALAAAIRRSEQTDIALRESVKVLRDAESKRDRAIQDRDFLRQQIEVAQITERYDRYVKAEQSLKEAEEYLEFSKVDDGVRDRIEEAYLDDQRAKAATDSAAASIETTALADITVQIAGKDFRLATNEVTKVQVEDEVLLVIPGVVQMRVSAGPDAKVLAEQRRRTWETYRRLCDDVGVADLNEARQAAQKRRDALRDRKEARKSIEQDLRDWTPDIMLANIEKLTERVTAYPVERPEYPPLPADYAEAESIASRSEGLVGDCQSGLRTREEAAEKAKEELAKSRVNETDLEVRRKVALTSKDEAETGLDVARKIQTDAVLMGVLAKAQQELDDSHNSLEETEAQLNAADPASLETRLENAKASKRRAIQDLESNRDRQSKLQASLDYRSERGPQGSYDEALSKLQNLEREHESTEARAEAAKLLRETFERHRRQAHQRYVLPFKEKIDQFGRIVFGSTFEVEVSEELEVVGRTLDDVTLETSQLSTGAREQLGVLSRLACAVIVSPDDGGVPVMIDDALGWSDPQRLQRMGAAIATAGQQCQVVILTCTPGRYSYVGNAKVVRL